MSTLHFRFPGVRRDVEVSPGTQVDLPLNYSSSVFVRVDEENLTLWRALITGVPSPLSVQAPVSAAGVFG